LKSLDCERPIRHYFDLSYHNPADKSEPFKHTTSHALHANVLAVAGAIFRFAVHDGRLAAR